EDKLNAFKRATSGVENEVAQFKPSQYFPAVLDNVEEGDSEVYRRTVKIASSTLRLPKKTVSVKLFRDRATGIKDGKRVYGRVLGIKALRGDGSLILREVDELIPLQAKIIEAIPTTSRILYAVGCGDSEKPHVIVVRSVETEDFLTAKVSNLHITLLLKVATNILDVCKTVSEVYYDLTPKPPATIEME
ncbi:MAG: hypothetical protein QXL67_02220, partial [Candidatus Bathyarchaeia archaeon]